MSQIPKRWFEFESVMPCAIGIVYIRRLSARVTAPGGPARAMQCGRKRQMPYEKPRARQTMSSPLTPHQK